MCVVDDLKQIFIVVTMLISNNLILLESLFMRVVPTKNASADAQQPIDDRKNDTVVNYQ